MKLSSRLNTNYGRRGKTFRLNNYRDRNKVDIEKKSRNQIPIVVKKSLREIIDRNIIEKLRSKLDWSGH